MGKHGRVAKMVAFVVAVIFIILVATTLPTYLSIVSDWKNPSEFGEHKVSISVKSTGTFPTNAKSIETPIIASFSISGEWGKPDYISWLGSSFSGFSDNGRVGWHSAGTFTGVTITVDVFGKNPTNGTMEKMAQIYAGNFTDGKWKVDSPSHIFGASNITLYEVVTTFSFVPDINSPTPTIFAVKTNDIEIPLT